MIEASTKQMREDLYLTAREVSEVTRKSVETLANERSRGEGLPFVKMGGKVVYRSSDVMQMLNENTYGFTWAKLEHGLKTYGMPPSEIEGLLKHLKREMV